MLALSQGGGENILSVKQEIGLLDRGKPGQPEFMEKDSRNKTGISRGVTDCRNG